MLSVLCSPTVFLKTECEGVFVTYALVFFSCCVYAVCIAFLFVTYDRTGFGCSIVAFDGYLLLVTNFVLSISYTQYDY